jgi:hypothetical protein
VSPGQVLNHGVPEELTAAMMSVAYEFFRLPAEEKAKLYSDDPGKKMRLSTSFNVRKETVHNWRDYLRLHCHPLEQYVPDWPDNPPSFRYHYLPPTLLLLQFCHLLVFLLCSADRCSSSPARLWKTTADPNKSVKLKSSFVIILLLFNF